LLISALRTYGDRDIRRPEIARALFVRSEVAKRLEEDLKGKALAARAERVWYSWTKEERRDLALRTEDYNSIVAFWHK
jgi:hypothetical protein